MSNIYKLVHEEALFWSHYGLPDGELVYCDTCKDKHEEIKWSLN